MDLQTLFIVVNVQGILIIGMAIIHILDARAKRKLTERIINQEDEMSQWIKGRKTLITQVLQVEKEFEELQTEFFNLKKQIECREH